MKSQAFHPAVPPSDPHSDTEMLTLDDYSEFEIKSETRHEYWSGQIKTKACTSPARGDIQSNLMDALSSLRQSPQLN